jgi:hypothetical protein
MQRREFVVGLGAAITGLIRTDAQALTHLPLVGYLDDGPVESFIFRQVEFRKGLAAADHFEGDNVAIEAIGEGFWSGPATWSTAVPRSWLRQAVCRRSSQRRR